MARKRVKVPVRTEEEEKETTAPEPEAKEVVSSTADESSGEVSQAPEGEGARAPEESVEVVETENLIEEMNRLREELEKARAEAEAYKDRYLRAMAEMDNMRKRLEKRFAEEAEQEKRRFLRAILPLVDNLEMVVKHSESDPKVLREGVRMILQEFMRTLEQEGVKPVPSVGQKFDPFVHEAVEVVETEQHPEETVVDEVQKGYTYKGSLLRPARVRVARKEE